MKRRLRKKLHLAEFQALGFRVEASLKKRATCASNAEWVWWDDMIELVEARGMCCGGGGGDADVGFYFERMPLSCTEADRVAIGEWFRGRDEFSAVRVLGLVDMYYLDGPRKRR